MPSRSPGLSAKEWRELLASRAFLIFAVAMPLLVGHAFTLAVATYAEVSGMGGGAAALAQGVSPLDGIVVPTFGAYAVALSLLFPFAAIRLVSEDKSNGALALLLQTRYSLAKQVAVKFAILLAAWVAAWLPGLVALALWRVHGGHLDASETLGVLAGHLLRGALVISVAMVAAAVTDGAAAAAVLTLAFTLGSWALDFIAQVQGGFAQQLAEFAPEGMLRSFERGEVRLDVIAILVVTVASHLALTVVWLHPGRERAARWAATAAIVLGSGVFSVAAGGLRSTWDLSEDRRNSFPAADERALQQIRQPVRIEVNLAPEDPRLADLDREVLRKLRRTLSDVVIVNSSGTRTGLFESGRPVAGTDSAGDAGTQPPAAGPQRPAYGEVWYQVGAHRAMSRSSVAPIVLETIYALAGVAAPAQTTSGAYPGYPLAVATPAAPWMFYAGFPLLVIFGWTVVHRAPYRHSSA